MYGIAGLLTGRTLAGRYLIEAVIGRGGMGAVYRAVDERLSRPVAVKVIGTATVDPAEHARLRARFQREARAAAALHHANVVQVHDFGTDPELDLDFLVMELLRGEDLAARLVRTGPPPLPVSLFILRHAARGLAAGHRAGMVHRDVKPGNLFLETGDGGEARVKVLDFGIAQVESEDGTLTHLTQFGRSPFSPAYASPEQLRGEEAITPASDVFSLAAVGYQLATGQRPFTAAEPARVAAELAESLRLLDERAPALDDAARAVLVRGLEWDPAERFRDAGEMADALEGRPVAAASAAAGRSSSPAPARAPVDVGEQTKLYARGPTPSPPQMRAAPPPAAAQTQLAPPPLSRQPIQASFPGADQVPQRRPAAPAPAPPQAAQSPGAVRRPGRVRRFFRALWDFTVTTVSLALFVGAWATAIMGVANGDERRLYLGAAASVLLTPLAVHRLTGRRGRYGFGVAGSVLATVGAVYAVGIDADPAIGLAAIFGLQILACFAMSWLTRRRPREEEAWQAGA